MLHATPLREFAAQWANQDHGSRVLGIGLSQALFRHGPGRSVQLPCFRQAALGQLLVRLGNKRLSLRGQLARLRAGIRPANAGAGNNDSNRQQLDYERPKTHETPRRYPNRMIE
jgi:hypothetical protein